MTVKFYAAFSLFLLLLPNPTTADIAPMQYSGYCFTPYSSPDIRMAEESVDIYVGDRYSDDVHIRRVRVVANFEMHNDNADTVEVDVGFPISTMFVDTDVTKPDSLRVARSLKEIEEFEIYKFVVSVDGGTPFEPEPAIVTGAFAHRIPSAHVWYGWKMAFPPGKTVVDVEYHVRTNYSYWRVTQQVAYVLSTGGLWKDDIGHAVVRVHLPSGYEEIRWALAWPAGYERHCNTLTWEWTDFKPEWRDRILVEFIPPEVMSEIRRLEQLEKQNSNDVDVLFELAKQYLYASFRKGPERSQYIDFAGLAEIRLDKVLAVDPSNCEAWRVYLREYFRMRKNSCGVGWWGMFEIRDKQRSLVARAYENCPDDEEIRLWYALYQEDRWKPPEEIGYTVVYYDEMPYIELNDFERDRTPILQKREEQVIDKYYSRTESISGVPFFKLKSKTLADSDKRKIIRILERRGFFRYENAKPLLRFYRDHPPDM